MCVSRLARLISQMLESVVCGSQRKEKAEESQTIASWISWRLQGKRVHVCLSRKREEALVLVFRLSFIISIPGSQSFFPSATTIQIMKEDHRLLKEDKKNTPYLFPYPSLLLMLLSFSLSAFFAPKILRRTRNESKFISG